jgi:hypothetical protein
MPAPRREKIAGFLAFALAVTAATAAPEAHAGLWDDLKDDFEMTYRSAGVEAAASSIDAATPESAKRAGLNLPGQKSTFTDKVVGRVSRDATMYTYSGYSSAQSALKVPGLPSSGALPGRGSNSIGKSIGKSVTDVASDTVQDGVRSATTNTVNKVLGVFFDRDDTPSP